MGYKITFHHAYVRMALITNGAGSKIHKKHPETYAHYGILRRLLNFMQSIGWEIQNDTETHRLIRRDYFVGKHGNLECKAHRYPAGFAVEFFQNINFENPHGGQYDFDKWDKMPYLVKLRYKVDTAKMRDFLISILPDAIITDEFVIKDPAERIKHQYVTSCHHSQKDMNFNLSDLDGTKLLRCNGYIHDREGVALKNGDVRYFRDYSGYLSCGKIYEGINDNWYVISNDILYCNKASHEFFTPTKEDFANRRLHRKSPVKQREARLNTLAGLSTHELQAELNRRGFKNRNRKKG